MQEGIDGNIWIGTNNGLSCYHPTENRFTNYTKQDGLPDTQFYWNASCHSQTEPSILVLLQDSQP